MPSCTYRSSDAGTWRQGYCSHFRVQAVGKQAREMVGRTPSRIKVLKPLRDGVIADFKVTEYMLSYFIQSAHRRRTLVHRFTPVSLSASLPKLPKSNGAQ